MSAVREIRQPQSGYHYVFGPFATPIARVAPGERVAVHTIDAFGDALTSEELKPSQVLGPYLNPQTGPLYIEDAEPGDTLAVKIIAIEATRDWAVSCTVPFFGGLTSTPWTPTLQPALEERTWIYKRNSSGNFAWRDRWEIPWAPFFGTMGVAPHIEAVSSLSPGAHGGNMDVPDITAGHTVYFPVHHPGALFYVGDAHAAQGQGELCGVALELAARGTFEFSVIKNQTIQWPRIESATHIMSVGSARPMEDAARIANHDLITWMVRDYGFDALDAYQLLSAAGELYVGNMVDTTYSLVARCHKRYLG
ncbi:MAG: acetamidase/formamidase family protein [Thermomicrobiales bacterium]